MKQFEEYLSYLKNQKNYSDNTIDSYKRDIDMFLMFIKNEGYSFNDVDNNLIRNFLRYEVVQGKSKRSNQRRIIALRRFYSWLLCEFTNTSVCGIILAQGKCTNLYIESTSTYKIICSATSQKGNYYEEAVFCKAIGTYRRN